ncbi:hypothetical protein [Alkalihalobacillus sp. TS-13]|nr:hypothetical protein [Alkalihalobacillus sp. TS-13]
MIPFQLFILTIIKRVRNNEADSTIVEHNARVKSLMDAAHDKSAQYMDMM